MVSSSSSNTSSTVEYTEQERYVQAALKNLGNDTETMAKLTGGLVEEMGSVLPILGSLIHVKGRPITRDMPVQLEYLFDTCIPRKSVMKAGRQIGKSTHQAARSIIFNSLIPYFETLTITPLFEMTRRFSANYMKPMIERSPIGSLVVDSNCDKNVLQRTFTNQSILHFSFACLDADRVRGLSISRCFFDETQDIPYDLIQEIVRTMDRSPYAIEDYAGTPKTFDGPLEVLWQNSSQAEWMIPCSCGYINNPHSEADGLHMIQDKGLCCARCKALVNPENGWWKHMRPELRRDFAGWHAPQIIFPFHYAEPRKWRTIVEAKHLAVPKRIFMNEILGESFDKGTKLITESELQKACVLPVKMSAAIAKKVRKAYAFIALGMDWGGRGVDEISKTKAAVLGMRPDGRLDLLYGEDMTGLSDAGEEVARGIQLYKEFNCSVFAHDAAGTAGTRDVLLNHARFPRNSVMPMSYVSAWSKDVITYREPSIGIRWPHYSLDKTRSLMLLIECIRNDYMFFPQYDSCKMFLRDILALVEEKSDTRRGGDVYIIRKAKDQCDDFAHAMNFAAMACFHMSGKYPDLLGAIRASSPEYLAMLEEMQKKGTTLEEWDEA